MDTEYDRSVVRAILASSSSCSQLYDVGLKPDTAVKNLKKVLMVSKQVENALDAGKDQTVLALKSIMSKREEEIRTLECSIDKLKKFRSDSRHIKIMEEKITLCNESLKNQQNILDCKDNHSKQKFNAAVKRRAVHIINEKRVKKRNLGAGAKRKLDESDEELTAKAIEQKTTVHGRRHDMVLYYHKRVKRDDLLSIANYHRMEQGKKLIKSATTVYNRAKPKRMRSLQAKRHIGMKICINIKMVVQYLFFRNEKYKTLLIIQLYQHEWKMEK